MRHGWIRSRLAREVLVQSIGIDPDDKLKIPAILWRSPRAVLAAFIDGLLDADGTTLRSGRTQLTTVSRRLAHEVAQAFLMLDRGCPSVSDYAPRPPGVQRQYRVGILGNDRIPSVQALYRSHASNRWYWRTRRAPGVIGIRRRTLRASGLHHPLDRDGWYYARVRSVVQGLAEPVYDINVPDGEAFVAGGFVAHNCGLRLSPSFRRVRLRPAADVVAEMRFLHETYGYRGFFFLDDELNVNRALPELLACIAAFRREIGEPFICRGLLKAELFTDAQAAALVEAGFRDLLIGFESGSDRILANIRKRATREDNTRAVAIARKHGLRVKALMSLGHPGESAETIRETERWLLETSPDQFDATILTVYPATAYYDHAIQTAPGVWTYTAPNTGDRVHSVEIDQFADTPYYKGIPGQYRAYAWTDHLAADELVAARDELEVTVRAKLGIPWPSGAAALQFEKSMGMSWGR